MDAVNNNTERQRRLRQRRKEAGLVDYRRAVTPEQAKALDEFIRDAEKLEQLHNELAALKAQWQADQYADGMPAQKAFWEGFERGAIKGQVNIRSHWEEWKSFRQRAREAGYEL